MGAMRCVLVSHTHWDREWYRSFQAFRARLVDAVDRLLELCARDPGYRFLLDGQSIALEDYLAIRPERRAELAALCRAGRVSIGPWYVQPDSLLPSGEAHVRNLLEGRRVAEAFGGASRVAYTPDSFGHPAQFPQLFAGFGLRAFVYWRGHGSELDALPSEWRWLAPDGSAVLACHLAAGYFSAATGPASEPASAARRIRGTLRELERRSRGDRLLLLNGIDHALPEPRTRELAEAIAKESGYAVERGLLEDFVEGLDPEPLPAFAGELVGGRAANLLPGVWSARTWIKLRNRRCEALLEGWAEPFAALGARLGLADERPALRAAWRELLQNQAHDSLGGCSRDTVHEQMRARFDAAEELAGETAQRALERLAGADVARLAPWTAEPELAVFNPSPHARSDVVCFALDPHPWLAPADGADAGGGIHPLLLKSLGPLGFRADGAPVRVAPAEESGRLALLPDRAGPDLELVVRDVPAFGWKRVALRAAEPCPDSVDAGREIAAGAVAVRARDDGTFDVSFGEQRFSGQGALLDLGDRGDSYDFDPVEGGEVALEQVSFERRRHPGGIERLAIARTLRVPARLAADRERRAPESGQLRVLTEIRLSEAVPRVDLRVCVENRAEDHRLQILFPSGAPQLRFQAATTFDVAERVPGPADARGWIHPAPATFPAQGFVHAGGLTVCAPGLAEAELRPDGAIAFTLLRAVGTLSRHDLRTRPGPAGPGSATPGAQCPGPFAARLSLLCGLDPAAARDAELGLRAVAAGRAPLVPAGRALLALAPRELLLSALKPAERGPGLVVRVLNPGAGELEARLEPGFPFERAQAVLLDESPAELPLRREGAALRFPVPPHALRSVLFE
jgi:alpha-mannosidase